MLKQLVVVNSQVHNASLIKLSMPMYEFRSENLTITTNQFFDGQIVSSTYIESNVTFYNTPFDFYGVKVSNCDFNYQRNALAVFELANYDFFLTFEWLRFEKCRVNAVEQWTLVAATHAYRLTMSQTDVLNNTFDCSYCTLINMNQVYTLKLNAFRLHPSNIRNETLISQ
jgi:hypothetical protein